MSEPKFKDGTRVTDGIQIYTVVSSYVPMVSGPDGSNVPMGRRYALKTSYNSNADAPESILRAAAGGRRRKTRKHTRRSRKTRRRYT